MYVHPTVTIKIGVYLEEQNCAAQKKNSIDCFESKDQQQAAASKNKHKPPYPKNYSRTSVTEIVIVEYLSF